MRNKDIFKSLITLAYPVVLEEILVTLLQYVDTAMVGHLGAEATASVNLTTTINWLLGSLASAIGVSVLALIARELGAKNEKEIKNLASQAFVLALIAGVVTEVITLSIAPYLPIWMHGDKAIQHQASVYFAIISLPMVFRVMEIVLGAAIRATKDTKTPMYISMVANVLNVGLNYLFIYALHMGVTGAAIGSAISYAIAGLLIFVAFRRNSLLRFTRADLRPKESVLKRLMGMSIPVMGTSFVSCMGYVMFASLVSSMGTTIFAAHSIAVTAEEVFYMAGYGVKTATSTLVGIALGERSNEKFHATCRVSLITILAIMSFNGLVLYLISYPLMTIFTSSVEVATLGALMLKIVAFSEPFYGLMVVLNGIYYGLGHTKYVFGVECIGMWCIRILFTFLCINVWGFGLAAVWYCMIADNISKAIMLALGFLFNKKSLFNIQEVSVE